MTQEALKLALEFIENSECGTADLEARIKEAMREQAMREVQRLGQEIEQEPVVGIAAIRTWFKDGRVVTQTLCNSWIDTTPPQPEQEPVGTVKELFTQTAWERLDLRGSTKVYLNTTPPQCTWVDLTSEEYDEIWRMDLNNKDIMDKTISKLKQKNMENT